jgi:hypothetical protein
VRRALDAKDPLDVPNALEAIGASGSCKATSMGAEWQQHDDQQQKAERVRCRWEECLDEAATKPRVVRVKC